MGAHFRPPTIFVDVDGVVADFDGYFQSEFGVDNRTLSDDEMWHLIESHGAFFRNLPVCPGALDFVSSLFALKPIFLTACPQRRFDEVARQKRAWLREHFAGVPAIFSPGGGAKTLYMHMEGDVLIDDFERNVTRWTLAGGFGIQHGGDFAPTMRHLCEYLWPNPTALGTSRAPSADLKTISGATTTDTPIASPLGAATVNLPEEKPFRITPA